MNKNIPLIKIANRVDITHHFGAKLVERRRGGLILIGSTGTEIGVPFLANDGGAKAYIHSLGEALHYEFKPRGVYVTVVPPPLTDTPVLAKLGFDLRTMPMKPLSVVTARFRETDVYNQDARQIASEQDCRGERSGRGLITDGRPVESLEPCKVRANDLTHNAVWLGKKSRLSGPILRVAEVAHPDANQAKPLVWSEAMQLRIVRRHCRAIRPIG